MLNWSDLLITQFRRQIQNKIFLCKIRYSVSGLYKNCHSNNPKIKDALQSTLTQSETIYVTDGSMIFPMLRRELIKICENPMNKNENEITFRYSLPAAIVSGLFVKIFMGKGDKKTVEKILGLAERISLIISLIFFVISFTMPTAIMKIFTGQINPKYLLPFQNIRKKE